MLIFERLPSCSLVDIIEEATDSRITHVGIVDRKGDEWVVIEAFGSAVQVTPLDKFLDRSGGYYSVKKIRGIHGKPKKVDKFIGAARKFLGTPYDAEFRYDNDKLYCSELVAEAARASGVNLFSVEVPVRWLNLDSQLVGQYIVRLKDAGAWGGYDSLILPPNTLFFSNDLEDVSYSGRPIEKRGIRVPDNVLYDTLPGGNVSEKFHYFLNNWMLSHEDRIEVIKRKTSEGNFDYHFRIEHDGLQKSLTLFGKFPEEKQLARDIRRFVKDSK